jgi:hypothetical protein
MVATALETGCMASLNFSFEIVIKSLTFTHIMSKFECIIKIGKLVFKTYNNSNKYEKFNNFEA